MTEYDDLNTYSGDTIHDMYVDNDYATNTGDLPYTDCDEADSSL